MLRHTLVFHSGANNVAGFPHALLPLETGRRDILLGARQVRSKSAHVPRINVAALANTAHLGHAVAQLLLEHYLLSWDAMGVTRTWLLLGTSFQWFATLLECVMPTKEYSFGSGDEIVGHLRRLTIRFTRRVFALSSVLFLRTVSGR